MGSRNVRRITRGNVLVKPARNHSDGVYERKQRQFLLRYDRDKSGWTQIRGYAPRTVLYGEIEEEISANKVERENHPRVAHHRCNAVEVRGLSLDVYETSFAASSPNPSINRWSIKILSLFGRGPCPVQDYFR